MISADDIVLLDTNVFGLLYVRPDDALRRGYPVETWRVALTGRRVAISFQTHAELLFGAIKDNWGERRREALQALFDTTPTIWPDAEVVRAEAQLREESRKAGHALAAAEQAADRWIGACAIALDLPLWTLDEKAFGSAPMIQRFEVPRA